jgi:hypothetical protein
VALPVWLEVLDGVGSVGEVEPVELVLLVPVELIVPDVPVAPVVSAEVVSPAGCVPLAAAANSVMCLRNSWSWLFTFGSSDVEALEELPAVGCDVLLPEVPVASPDVLLDEVDPLALVSVLVVSLLGPSRAVRSRSSAISCLFQFPEALLRAALADDDADALGDGFARYARCSAANSRRISFILDAWRPVTALRGMPSRTCFASVKCWTAAPAVLGYALSLCAVGDCDVCDPVLLAWPVWAAARTGSAMSAAVPNTVGHGDVRVIDAPPRCTMSVFPRAWREQ